MKPTAVEITAGVPRLAEIRRQRQQLSERRLRLRREQAAAFSPEMAAKIGALGDDLRALEDEERALRSQIRFGPREAILRRAHKEQRLLQELHVREWAPSARRSLRLPALADGQLGSEAGALGGQPALRRGT